jgi:hypothetical protein
LHYDNIEVLNEKLAEVDDVDPDWSILSNAGGIENNLYQRIAITIAYGDGFEQFQGKFPQKVCSVDENFIVIKRSANLSLSNDISGFHLYGTDICLIAELLGYSAYVINFKLVHKSYGNPNKSYYKILKKLIGKYVKFMRSRTIVNTITDFRLSPSSINTKLFNIKLTKKVSRKITKWKTPDRKHINNISKNK